MNFFQALRPAKSRFREQDEVLKRLEAKREVLRSDLSAALAKIVPEEQKKKEAPE